MKPFIQKVDITHYSKGWLKKICSCTRKCTTGVTVTIHDEGFTMCEGEAKKTLYDLMDALDVGGDTSWKEADDQFILDHYEESGMYRGFNKYISVSLNKTDRQVKSKIQAMRNKGLLDGKTRRRKYHEWTDEEEQTVLDYFKGNEETKGAYKILSEKLGLTYDQVKGKVYVMKEKGLL